MQRTLDTLALFGICGVLVVAFYYQFVLGELPCPLCALQRVGFIVAGVALVLNLRAGYSPAHYGLALLSAVAAGSASLRQIALHVVPNTGHYGSALFGFHFYTWAFVGYGALVVYVGAMLTARARSGGARPRLRNRTRRSRSPAGCSSPSPPRMRRRLPRSADWGRARTIRSAICGGRVASPSRR